MHVPAWPYRYLFLPGPSGPSACRAGQRARAMVMIGLSGRNGPMWPGKSQRAGRGAGRGPWALLCTTSRQGADLGTEKGGRGRVPGLQVGTVLDAGAQAGTDHPVC